MPVRRGEGGSILIVVACMVLIIAAFCTVSLMVSANDTQQARMAALSTKALFVAEAGLQQEVDALSGLRNLGWLGQPFQPFNNLAGTQPQNGAWLIKDGISVGQYDVSITSVTTIDQYTLDMGIHVIAYVPSKTSPQPVMRTVDAVARVSQSRSHVFDYVYFIHNWGWYYGDTIIANGNVRANGQFDGGGYKGTINGCPRFNNLVGTSLSGYIDAGGLYAGWNIVGTQNMQGTVNGTWTQADANAGSCTQAQVGTNKYQHPYVDQIAMPNLSDLTPYEQLATNLNSSIKIGSTTIVSHVQGDNTGEQQNLYLVGTSSQPIVINGPVVVRGSVIISGYVTGNGAIYAGGNVYIPKNLQYVHSATALPTAPNQTSMNSWLVTNQNADAVGLFARKHIVIGDYTNSNWQSNVQSWVNDSRNRSDEDCGLDLIPNTKAGRDGILGTADDDVLESDGQWTVNHYTAAQQVAGLIPAGKNVGDVIPGTGEDVDGDGVRGYTVQMSEFNVPAALNSTNWAGNIPSGTSGYSSLSSTQITHVDGALYTNHTVGMLTLASGDLTFNGCVVSRNEDIVYATNHVIFNYDYRLLSGGQSSGFYLPGVWNPVDITMWRSN